MTPLLAVVKPSVVVVATTCSRCYVSLLMLAASTERIPGSTSVVPAVVIASLVTVLGVLVLPEMKYTHQIMNIAQNHIASCKLASCI